MALPDVSDGGSTSPEWLVTYGDMMSLLLTFFIMLVSMSDIKDDQKYQAILDSIYQRFGFDSSVPSLLPGQFKPQNSQFQQLATLGRARRANTMRGGDKVPAPVGDSPRVKSIRAGEHLTIGGVLYFDEDSADLAEAYLRDLQILAQSIGGKTQKIEVRGHTSRRPLPAGTPYQDAWHLAYQRCHNTMEALQNLGVNPRRFRIALAADNEPAHLAGDLSEQKQNSRVEVVMLDERVEDLEGTEEEREKNYVAE